MNGVERPTLYIFGVLFTVLHALLMGAVSILIAGVLLQVIDVGIDWVPFRESAFVEFMIDMGGWFFLALALFYGFVVFTCWMSWLGSRGWTWVLVILSALGILNSGPLSFALGVLTIIGSMQLQDALRERESEPGTARNA